MKNYTITVNGNVYDVTVEENGHLEPVPCNKRSHYSEKPTYHIKE